MSMAQSGNSVAPLVGAWIEILGRFHAYNHARSLLSWERGLKSIIISKMLIKSLVAPLVGAWIEISYIAIRDRKLSVAPLVGAWIEIMMLLMVLLLVLVAPLVGAWIEIYLIIDPLKARWKSLLSWERGLKYHTRR